MTSTGITPVFAFAQTRLRTTTVTRRTTTIKTSTKKAPVGTAGQLCKLGTDCRSGQCKNSRCL
ncbi:hypothetical protein M427DRAFT_53690 [Gonapodya prolifera JEL478]|uniref:Uncharacterized protein n=1 Tax=Gonapodya prolifera (strain JEL478) TaxID=1344416 RepID=A0A139APU0_GONPJ|nr:hypothetical protein M427DRAFT_53690 [Gonapodya prolifera JEL478]|eukprot:KXS18759.1 hypothetical protein M427DRAFT_53690 [Gonapodya prolifera JEL478]